MGIRLVAMPLALLFPLPAMAARLSMGVGQADPDMIRLDILWTMGSLDTASVDVDGFAFRFNVDPPPSPDRSLTVVSVTVPPGWNPITEGVGQPLTELDFFFGADDATGEGIEGTGEEFSLVLGSIFLVPNGDVAGTEISFRHNTPQDPLPAAFDGPRDWQLRWQEEVTGPLQFDIGTGNPGDAGTAWESHGYETYQPLIIPEPGSVGLLSLGALATLRRRR